MLAHGTLEILSPFSIIYIYIYLYIHSNAAYTVYVHSESHLYTRKQGCTENGIKACNCIIKYLHMYSTCLIFESYI